MNREKIILKSENGYHISCYDHMFARQRAVMVCLHGFAGDKNSSVIARLTEYIQSYGIGTFVFDWPAHGESDANYQDLRVEHCLADLDTVIKYIRDRFNGPLYCFATSFGGYLAAAYHLAHPDTFDKIILRSPALNMGEVFLSLKPLEIRQALEEGQVLDFGFEQPLLVSIDLYHDVKKHDIFKEKVKSPEKILVIHGDLDEDVPLSDSEEFCERNGITLHVIQGCDHRYKNPGEVEEVLQLTGDFL